MNNVKACSWYLKGELCKSCKVSTTFHVFILAIRIYRSGFFFFLLISALTHSFFLFVLSPTSLSSAPESFFSPQCTRNFSCSFTRSLPRFVLLLIRFCLCTRRSYTLSSPPLPIGLHWRNAITFPISGPALVLHTHTQMQPPSSNFLSSVHPLSYL